MNSLYYISIEVLIDFNNPLNANPEKWSNTLKQIVGNLPTICLSVFDHFMNLALKGLTRLITFFLLVLLHTISKIGMYGLLYTLTDSL